MKKKERLLSALKVTGKRKIKLEKFSPDAADGVKDKEQARKELAGLQEELNVLQQKLYAEARRGLLIVFQAIDTGGKDGVIRRVFGPLNPQGVVVASFKRPGAEELSHDYLWRVHARVPARGMIGIFNRSHYEDVLVHRVHKLLPNKILQERYRQINDFERYLGENDVAVVKFFLHISRDEQKRRLESRLADPNKRWKFAIGDLGERKLWDKYQEAFAAMIEKCSTERAPWFVIPADRKWYRDWAVAAVVAETLAGIKPEFPKEQEGLDHIVIE